MKILKCIGWTALLTFQRVIVLDNYRSCKLNTSETASESYELSLRFNPLSLKCAISPYISFFDGCNSKTVGSMNMKWLQLDPALIQILLIFKRISLSTLLSKGTVIYSLFFKTFSFDLECIIMNQSKSDQDGQYLIFSFF